MKKNGSGKRNGAFSFFVYVLVGLCVVFAASLHAPQILAFPYERQIGDTKVYSDDQIPDAMISVLAQSDQLLRSSPIYSRAYGRQIFLTNGGWRWHVLSLRMLGAFAHTRPFSEVMVINRSDAMRDKVWNGSPVAGERSLSGVIAHERTHSLIRAHFGMLADVMYPTWLREGYCDVVAGGGSLSDTQAAILIAHHMRIPALTYYEGRKRVEAILNENGGSVDKLFATQADD